MTSPSSSTTGSDGSISDWEDDVPLLTQSLFDNTTHASPDAAIQHDSTHHGFDLRKRSDLDMYGKIRLINLIRRDHLSPALALTTVPDDDSLLTPVIPDDPLLQHSFDDSWSDDEPDASPSDQLALARAEISALRQVDNDTHYFDSYSENEIHEIMLKDTIRTTAYGRFILSNPDIFRGATVLDVGCGTGILSMFAARAGARKVYAVEASSLASKTRAIVAQNGLDDVVDVLNGKMEELELPEPVDVIVSEWMGYMLLYESMLDSVLNARDRFLKSSGLMVPSQAKVFLSGITGEQVYKDRVGFWKEIYGFDMTPMSSSHATEGLIENVPHSEVVTDDAVVRDINIHAATSRSLDFFSAFTLTVTTSCTMRAFLTHFDVFFGVDRDPIDGPAAVDTTPYTMSQTLATSTLGPVTFTTGTRGPPTHWQQVAFLLKSPLALDTGARIHGEFFCRKSSSNSRELDVEIHYTLDKASERRSWTMMTYKVR